MPAKRVMRWALPAFALLLACQGDDSGDGAENAQTTQTSDQTTSTSGESETGAGDPVCVVNGGAYGKCSEALCQCVLGGDLYQYCSKSCTASSECGDASEFPGATPACEPVNANDPTNMICVLHCQTTADCPCGLECESTYLICSEPQIQPTG